MKQSVYGEGLHFRIPLIQNVINYEVRTRPFVYHTLTQTKDLQKIDISLRVLYQPESEQLPRIYNDIGENYAERVFPSIGNEIMKSVVALKTAEELTTQREKVSQELRETLSQRSKEFGIVIKDCAITDFKYSPEFSKAVELKQIAQQYAEREKFVVMKNEEVKKAAIIRAEGESMAAQLISDSIKEHGPGLVALRKIEAARHIAQAVQGNPNLAFVSSGNTVNMLNIPAGAGR